MHVRALEVGLAEDLAERYKLDAYLRLGLIFIKTRVESFCLIFGIGHSLGAP